MAVFTVTLVYFAWKMIALEAVGVLAPDAAALVVLVPVLIVASGVALADRRLSGGGPHVLMAALATLAVLALVAVAAALANDGFVRQITLAVLPAALSVAAVLGGGERFGAGRLSNGLSAAWMVAALATLADGFAPRDARRALPIGVYVVFAAAVLYMRGAGDAGASGQQHDAVAYLATVAAGGLLASAPNLAAKIGIGE